MLTKTFSPRKLAWFLLIGPLALFPSCVLAVDAGASSATLFVAEDASTTSLDLSTEVTGDDPEIFSVGASGSGTVTITGDEEISYAPAANFYGTEYITYDVRSTATLDGAVSVAQGLVTVTVTSVNDAPITIDDTVTIQEDADQTTINVASNDSDDDTATADLNISAASITSGDTSGEVSYSGGSVLYTPTGNFNGTTVISYTVEDTYTTPATAAGTLTVTVTAVNDAPDTTSTILSPATEAVTEDTATDIDMSSYVTDTADDDSLTITSVTYSGSGSATITGDDLIISYTPSINFTGSENIYYSAADDEGGTVSGMITVTVSSVAENPVATSDTAIVTEDSNDNEIDVKINDTDDDDAYAELVILNPTISSTSGLGSVTTAGSVSVISQKISYTPAPNFYGSETITYTLRDTEGLTDEGSLIVTVTNANDGPIAIDDTASTAANTAVTIAVLDNDTDYESDTLSIASVSAPSYGTTTISGTSIIYTPTTDYSGSDTFTYEVTDITGATSTGTVTITITVANVGSCATSASTLSDVSNGCTVAPSAFRARVYAFGLCTAAPGRPEVGSSYDLSSCQLMYDGTSGSGTAVTFGATNTSYSFPSFTAPANGSYTHGVLIIGNSFDAKGILELSGTNCVTTATSPYIQCGASYTIDDAVYIPSSTVDYFYTAGTYRYDFVSDSVTADIINTNNELVADDTAGSYILAIQEFSSPQRISDSTQTIDIGFRISQGLSIDTSASSVSASPFSIRFQVD